MMGEAIYKTYEDLPLMISVSELTKVMGISRAGAYDLARRNDFPKIKIGTRIVVPKQKFLEWVELQVKENGDENENYTI